MSDRLNDDARPWSAAAAAAATATAVGEGETWYAPGKGMCTGGDSDANKCRRRFHTSRVVIHLHNYFFFIFLFDGSSITLYTLSVSTGSMLSMSSLGGSCPLVDGDYRCIAAIRTPVDLEMASFSFQFDTITRFTQCNFSFSVVKVCEASEISSRFHYLVV
jgi:hypothetical protein